MLEYPFFMLSTIFTTFQLNGKLMKKLQQSFMKNILVNLWAPYQKRQILDFRIDKYEHFEVVDILHKPIKSKAKFHFFLKINEFKIVFDIAKKPFHSDSYFIRGFVIIYHVLVILCLSVRSLKMDAKLVGRISVNT